MAYVHGSRRDPILPRYVTHAGSVWALLSEPRHFFVCGGATALMMLPYPRVMVPVRTRAILQVVIVPVLVSGAARCAVECLVWMAIPSTYALRGAVAKNHRRHQTIPILLHYLAIRIWVQMFDRRNRGFPMICQLPIQ